MPETYESTVPITVRVSPETRDRLKAMAAADRRPLSMFVRLILENHVEQAGESQSRKK